MSDVINRTARDSSGALRQAFSVNTPDYSTDDWLINPDLSGVSGVEKYYWKVTGSPPGGAVEEMSSGEKAAVDATRLDEAKTAKKLSLRSDATAYFATRYDIEDQNWFQTLYLEAFQSGKTNRRAYIGTWVTWMEGCVENVKDKVVDVGTASTVSEVEAIALSTTAMTAADPDITLGGILAIPD